MPRKKPKPKASPYRVHLVDGLKYAIEIAVLVKEFFGEEGAEGTAFIGVEWFLAFKGGDICAFAGLIPHSVVEANSAYLNRAGVLPAHRGQGLQGKLIEARCKRAKALGAKFASSDTYDNPHSANNLIAAGFRAYRPAKGWRQDGAMYWRKRL